jgi:hypothetical protein
MIGVHVKESAADGDRAIITMAGSSRFDHLAVSIDCAPVVEALLAEHA